MNLLGKVSEFEVLRETDLGYMLANAASHDEFFLHRNETNFRKLYPGDKVSAFIYADKLARPTASLNMPTVTVDKIGFGEVVAVGESLGVFISIGSSKDVLLSKDDLPTNHKEWPIKGDMILCQLRLRGDRLIVKPSNKDDMVDLNNEDLLTINELVSAYVYRITDEGVNLVSENYSVIFVHLDNLRKNYRIGEKVEVKILQRNSDDYSGTLLEDKRDTINKDKNLILEYLKSHHGMMAITDKSEPIVIRQVFDISKRAFKTALSALYKEHLIEIHDDKILLL